MIQNTIYFTACSDIIQGNEDFSKFEVVFSCKFCCCQSWKLSSCFVEGDGVECTLMICLNMKLFVTVKQVNNLVTLKDFTTVTRSNKFACHQFALVVTKGQKIKSRFQRGRVTSLFSRTDH
jgi:hypothetical protein